MSIGELARGVDSAGNDRKAFHSGRQPIHLSLTQAGQQSVQGRYKMTMGLEPMNPLDWIEIDENYEEELAIRKNLIKNNRSTVIHSMPGVRP